MSPASGSQHRESISQDIPGLGQVLFVPSKRAKRMSISIRPGCPVRIAYPRCTTLMQAVAFLEKHRDWAQKHVARVKQMERMHRRQAGMPAFCGDEAGAAQWLCRRLQMLADRYGFKFSRVSIRRQKTRWGSCSAKNSISLNIRLAHLTPQLCDYVLLHELVHTKVKNHSKQFWRCLDVCCAGQARQLDKQLKQYLYR
ncbi:MAG TPA: DUF45 domain-containing protein [Anaerohalosphaeraceae bacterium]|nr:M48 family metallopeptidase [Phycisphaerae bacterium]HOK95880.1 DUF45 domain-containing protein [Anaerohalosphaeraceae bacterium]HOL32062.1 DUF45 domain-containing protein [Anaerohalosphaeraceae bacterium]HOM75254.1 DUF45 domain-containing protein [Anaerohalosphaeraceae bacterium]HPC64513.1 DUF45 domain-containing protein [Anaerohalosphaeraceae bacterium]